MTYENKTAKELDIIGFLWSQIRYKTRFYVAKYGDICIEATPEWIVILYKKVFFLNRMLEECFKDFAGKFSFGIPVRRVWPRDPKPAKELRFLHMHTHRHPKNINSLPTNTSISTAITLSSAIFSTTQANFTLTLTSNNIAIGIIEREIAATVALCKQRTCFTLNYQKTRMIRKELGTIESSVVLTLTWSWKMHTVKASNTGVAFVAFNVGVALTYTRSLQRIYNFKMTPLTSVIATIHQYPALFATGRSKLTNLYILQNIYIHFTANARRQNSSSNHYFFLNQRSVL